MKELPPAFRTIPSGGELVEALDAAFGKHRGWIQATGFVEEVELKLGADGPDARRTFRGRFALAALGGPLGGPYGATLARSVGDKVEVLAGVLVRARSGGVQALCVSSGEAPAAEAPGFATRPLVSAFAAKVGVSSAAPEEDEADEPVPDRGDLVEHFAFGVLEVLTVTGDRLVLRDRGGQGRIREISMDRLTVTGPTEFDGKRLFRLARR